MIDISPIVQVFLMSWAIYIYYDIKDIYKSNMENKLNPILLLAFVFISIIVLALLLNIP